MKNTILTVLGLFYLIIINAQTLPTIQWIYDIGAPAFGSAASADLDKDGKLEIVFTTYTNDGRAHCLNAEDGTVHWIYNIGGCGDVAPLIYDVDNDDTMDVIINGSCNPTIFCINGKSGLLKWSAPSGGGDSPPTIADLDNDGNLEILFGNFNGQVRILNAENGSLYRNIQVAAVAVQTEPTICDADGDNLPDFIACNHFNYSGCYTYCFNPRTADTIWVNYMPDTVSTYYAYHGGALADIDLDGKDEYVIGANNGTIRALNVEDGSVLWTKSGLNSVMSAISIADLDNDDTLEIVYNNNDYITFDDHIGILNGTDGSLEWRYDLTFTAFRGMAISDLNGNGSPDLVLGVYMGGFMAVEAYNGLLWYTDLDVHFQQGLPWFDVDHGPLIADFDGDDSLEVFTVAGYGTYTPDSLNCGKAFMLNAGAGNCPSWLMFRQDAKRSGYLSENDINATCNIPSAFNKLDGGQELHLIAYPIPFEDKITLKIQSTHSGKALLSISDIYGRHIKGLAIEISSSDSLIELDAADLVAGMYLCKIETENGKKSTVKLIKTERN